MVLAIPAIAFAQEIFTKDTFNKVVLFVALLVADILSSALWVVGLGLVVSAITDLNKHGSEDTDAILLLIYGIILATEGKVFEKIKERRKR
jgi:phosphotransferase system  glucose/maltose/N-acetylglucosamine-specific IIC component